MSRSDIRMIQQAIGNRWPIPAETRERLVVQLLDVLETATDHRAKVAAAKALIEADKLNLEDEKRRDPEKELKASIDLTTGERPLLTQEEIRAMTDDELLELIRLGEEKVGS